MTALSLFFRFLYIPDGFRYFFTLCMRDKGTCSFPCITDVKNHKYLLIFRKSQLFRSYFRIKEINPAALNSCCLCSQHHMGCNNGCILYSRITFFTRLTLPTAKAGGFLEVSYIPIANASSFCLLHTAFNRLFYRLTGNGR